MSFMERLDLALRSMEAIRCKVGPLVLVFTRERWGELEGLFELDKEEVEGLPWGLVWATPVELYETADEVLAREKVLVSEGKEVVVGY